MALFFTSPILYYVLDRVFAVTVRAKVKESALVQEGKGVVAMLRLMLVTVVASYTVDDDLLSECQVCLAHYDMSSFLHGNYFLDISRS